MSARPPKGITVYWALVALTDDPSGLHTKVMLEAQTLEDAIAFFHEQHGDERVVSVWGEWESKLPRR
jgi:hypothetical protein